MIKGTPVKRSLLIAIITLFFGLGAKAQPPAHTGKFSPFIDNNINGFWEYLPRNYNTDISTKYPLLIFIHGAGEQGSDQSMTTLNKVLRSGPPRLINNGNFPDSFNVGGQWYKFIVISPQIKVGISGSTSIIEPSTIDAVIEYACSEYRIDRTRIYLCGFSMGGGATWDYAGSSLIAAKKLAGIVVAAGAGDLSTTEATNIAEGGLPIVATHNEHDNVIPVSRTVANIDQIMASTPAINPLPRPVYWSTGGHNVSNRTYEDIQPNTTVDGNLRDTLGVNIYEWFLQHFRPSVALPVSWQSFVVRAQNGKAFLQWSVSDQLNVKEYIVEKSRNGAQWTGIFSIASTNAAGVQSYTFTDASSAPGLTYYRIRQVDLNNRFAYSPVKTFNPAMVPKLLVYPNPFIRELRIDADFPGTDLVVKLTNAEGKIVMVQKQAAGSIHGELVIKNLDRLSNGNYYLSISDTYGRNLYGSHVVKK